MIFGRKTYAILFLLMALLIPLFFISGIFDVYEGAKSMGTGMTGSDLGGVGMKAAISGTADNAQKQKAELIKKTEAELAEAQKQLDELIATEKSLTTIESFVEGAAVKPPAKGKPPAPAPAPAKAKPPAPAPAPASAKAKSAALAPAPAKPTASAPAPASAKPTASAPAPASAKEAKLKTVLTAKIEAEKKVNSKKKVLDALRK
jgi:hypothetical protein